jgi:hypothetical protein
MGEQVQAPSLHSELSASEAFPIIWDSRASVCITFDKEDFVDMNDDCDLAMLQGFSNGDGQSLKGVGNVQWYIQDYNGQPRCIVIKAYYVPTSCVHLLSTSALL